MHALADLDIWHALFGVARSNNEEAPRSQFSFNGNEHTACYYLVDGIYIEWIAFMKTIALPPKREA